MQCSLKGEAGHLTAQEGAAYRFISFINHIESALPCQHTFDLVTWGSFHDDGLRTSLYHVQYQDRLASLRHDMHRQEAACSACICLSSAWDIVFVDCQRQQ